MRDSRRTLVQRSATIAVLAFVGAALSRDAIEAHGGGPGARLLVYGIELVVCLTALVTIEWLFLRRSRIRGSAPRA